MKRFFSKLLVFTMTFAILLNTCIASFADSPQPSVSAQFAVLMDYETGKVIYEKNGNAKLYPASTTKVWTAYLVLKHVHDLNEIIEIEEQPNVEGSSMYLKEGESFTIKQLLDALLIRSANDAAVILAEHVSGSVEKFVELMNDEAKLIDADNTNFTNPHGLPDENHISTAYDMALMGREAMSNEVFRKIVQTERVQFEPTEQYEEERHFPNTNKFINSNEKINYKGQEIDIEYDIVDGIKTGYTDDAGRCLLASAVKNDMRLITSVFKAEGNDLYVDSRTLLDYGFDNYKSFTIADKKSFADSKKIMFTKQKELTYEPEYSYKLMLPKDSKTDNYTTKVILEDVDLPVIKGDKVGTLEIHNNETLEHSIDLVATNNVNSIFAFITENKALISALKFIGMIIVVLLLAIVGLIIRKKVIRNKKKSMYSNKSNTKNKNIYSKPSSKKKTSKNNVSYYSNYAKKKKRKK